MNTQKMKAVVCTKYGSPDYLKIREVERPSPKPNELLIKIYTATATTADTMLRKGDPFISRLFFGLSKPRKDIIGTGFAGEVVAVGESVNRFKEGDQIFGETAMNFGANAEYVCLPEDGVLINKPSSISYEEAAPVCDGHLTSYNFLRNQVKIKNGQKVLINGASGSLGTAAVQIAKYYGAEVTGVCGPSNIELVKSLGADHVIDYTKTDFTETAKTYDVIYDTVGKLSVTKSKKVLSENGVVLSPVLKFGYLFHMLLSSVTGKEKVKFSATGVLPAPKLREFLVKITELMQTGHLKTVIDKQFSLDGVVEAHKYVDGGHKKGNVVLNVV